jgi:hypothetical protein
MPQYVAQKTFLGRFGQMHRGMTYTLPDGYARDLMANGLVRRASHDQAPQNAAHDAAPNTLGEDTAGQRDDGTAAPSSVSLQARRSRRPTAFTLKQGPGVTLPRK